MHAKLVGVDIAHLRWLPSTFSAFFLNFSLDMCVLQQFPTFVFVRFHFNCETVIFFFFVCEEQKILFIFNAKVIIFLTLQARFVVATIFFYCIFLSCRLSVECILAFEFVSCDEEINATGNDKMQLPSVQSKKKNRSTQHEQKNQPDSMSHFMLTITKKIL